NDQHSDEAVRELYAQIKLSNGPDFLLMASVTDPDNLDSAIRTKFAREIVLSRVTPSERDPWKHLVLRPSVKEQLSDLLRSVQAGGPGFNTLIFGPPGTGKTEIIRGLAESTRLPFFAASGPLGFRGKYVGESSNLVRQVFERARRDSPSIVYL